MSPRKLTSDDKQEILKLYRQTAETTSTLAEKFGVSSSTISRFLKTHLSDLEYEELIQQKRLARTTKSDVEDPLADGDRILTVADKPVGAIADHLILPEPEIVEHFQKSIAVELRSVEAIDIGELFGDDLPRMGDDEEDDDLDGDEDDDLDEDDEDEDEDWNEENDHDFSDTITAQGDITVLPLSDAAFPRTCYLVIDRTSELIARPLKEFSHLGTIPPEETLQKTLPVFDNHRIARRFSNRFQRVIKVPDGKMLQKTSSHLQAKGITRIIMDGRIYSLSTP